MRTYQIEGKEYKLPNVLNPFQLEMYVHLINWKWKNITQKVGYNQHKGMKIPYDAILPDEIKNDFQIIYPPILSVFKEHHKKYPFRIHKFFNHMASSQAANANLFLPILLHPKADTILQKLKPDFNRLAKSKLDKGFRIEFWDSKSEEGLLGDHTQTSGTDSDIAIAYYNKNDELSLWLIEHKLTENEFTECGGAKSKNRTTRHKCNKSVNDIIKNKHYCYYHDVRRFNYWDITEKNRSFFSNGGTDEECPFKGGLNQLWRNQLLALSIDNGQLPPFTNAHFSVVHHSENTALNDSMEKYDNLIADKTKFSHFNSKKVLDAASDINDPILNKWITWYKTLYNI
jgi:hypothetical protein